MNKKYYASKWALVIWGINSIIFVYVGLALLFSEKLLWVSVLLCIVGAYFASAVIVKLLHPCFVINTNSISIRTNLGRNKILKPLSEYKIEGFIRNCIYLKRGKKVVNINGVQLSNKHAKELYNDISSFINN